VTANDISLNYLTYLWQSYKRMHVFNVLNNTL